MITMTVLKTYSEPKKRLKIRNYKTTDYGTQKPKTALRLQFIWPRSKSYDGAKNSFGTKKTPRPRNMARESDINLFGTKKPP